MLKGKELLLLRVKNDIKAKDIAIALGVSKAYISMLEKEKQAIPIHIYKKWIKIVKGDEG